MTLLGIAMSLFPAFVVALAAACGLWGVARQTLWAIPALLGVVYLLPVACFRLHNALLPLAAGGSRLVGRRYSRWWGGHQMQLVYIAIPALESLLRLFPGLYSAWLRLWGARIGSGVHWTPRVEITDRSLLEIGDRVVLGHHAILYAHVIRPMKGNLLLYVAPIRIGDGAFVGAHSVIGPGAEIGGGARLEAGSHIRPREVVV